MDSPDGIIPSFCIGQHESKRILPITSEVVQLAHDSNYDMVTTPITTTHFQTRVLSLLSSHLANSQAVSRDDAGTFMTTGNMKPLVVPQLGPADTHLTPNEAMSQVVGVTSSWIDMCSPDPLISDISRQAFMLEVGYAAFCGIGYLLIPGPKLHHKGMQSDGATYYARAIQDAISLGPYIQFHIWMNMVDNQGLEIDEIGDLGPLAREEFFDDLPEETPKIDLFGAWDGWDSIRRTCKYHSRLFVALSLPKHLPPMSVQSRWYSEPVHLFTIDPNTFIKNQKGFPVLGKAHQALILRFMRLRTAPWILLCDVGPIPGLETLTSSNLPGTEYPSLAQAVAKTQKQDPTPHLSYMRNLQQRQTPRTAIERFGTGYQDYLQAPLQPLTVNLESITYEVFEKDPIKYEWYERAIAKALSDWVGEKKPTSNPDGRVVVAVVGAGRGPLVTRALNASAQSGVGIDLWVVEKNQNAFVLLQRHNQNLWGGKVKLVHSDMRAWKGPLVQKSLPVPTEPVGQSLGIEDQLLYTPDAKNPAPAKAELTETIHAKVDIVISELLGSFGDNELSPECLDGVNHLLNPTHGISIPESYTAHLTPISAPKLHADVTNQTISNPAAPETPYVVMLHAIDYLSTEQTGNNTANNVRASVATVPTEPSTPFVQTAWSFSHPNRDIPPQPASTSMISNSHNVRRTRLAFPIPNRGVCHGLAGYFETVLYRDVELSTNPVTMDSKSANMISWFPIYFPLKTPLNVPDNGEVVVTMYRQTDDRKVWYEWMVEVFALEGGSESLSGSGLGSDRIAPVMSGAKNSPGADAARKDATDSHRPQKKARGPRRVRVGMSDLHSSIKEGCLM